MLTDRPPGPIVKPQQTETSNECNVSHLSGVALSQDSSGKWRFIGIPYWTCNNPAAHYYWEGGTTQVTPLNISQPKKKRLRGRAYHEPPLSWLDHPSPTSKWSYLTNQDFFLPRKGGHLREGLLQNPIKCPVSVWRGNWVVRLQGKSNESTLHETKIAPEKMVSQKESNLPTSNFQVLC